MQRRLRPMVPSPCNTPMPDKYRSEDYRGRLYSVYLRPWTLHKPWASRHVPHICDLNWVPRRIPIEQVRRRLRGKNAAPTDVPTRSYAAAWRQYIEGGVVSRHAQRLIVQFMSANCGKSRRQDIAEEETARKEKDCPPNEVALTRLHQILDELGQGNAAPKSKRKSAQQAREADSDEEDDKAQHSEQMHNALSTTAQLWKRNPSPWDVTRENMKSMQFDISKRQTSKSKRSRGRNAHEPETAQPAAYMNFSRSSVTQWWKKARSSKKPPTPEQEAFLDYVVQRCVQEDQEFNKWKAPAKEGKAKGG